MELERIWEAYVSLLVDQALQELSKNQYNLVVPNTATTANLGQ